MANITTVTKTEERTPLTVARRAFVTQTVFSALDLDRSLRYALSTDRNQEGDLIIWTSSLAQDDGYVIDLGLCRTCRTIMSEVLGIMFIESLCPRKTIAWDEITAYLHVPRNDKWYRKSLKEIQEETKEKQNDKNI